jgi:hypothetical protein
MAKLDLNDEVCLRINGKGFGVVEEINGEIANIKWRNGKRSHLHYSKILKVLCADRDSRKKNDNSLNPDGFKWTGKRLVRKAWNMKTEEYDGIV